jgi:hypothetical protein
MPPSWWEIPDHMADETTPEAAVQFDHLMTQIWFFQLAALLHLPFMLRAGSERRYDYSKFSCFHASREMMHRYLAMRLVENKSFCCKIVDFGALTATVTLLLDLLNPAAPNESRETRQQKQEDRALVNTVLQKLEELSIGGRDVVATQAVNIIRTLLSVDSPSASATGNLRLTIPYFGTINIARPPASPASLDFPMVHHPQVLPEQRSVSQLSQAWQGLPYPSPNSTNVPVVSFTSSHFPPLMQEPSIQDWQLPEADTLYFDSLLNTDIEGNWIF